MKSYFSVIIPTLNEERFLPQLLESLAGQTFRDFEVIISDGNSSDKTVAIAESFAAKLPQLVIIKNKQGNLPVQRNGGAKATQGDWFLFLDADGVMLPYGLERVKTFIDREQPAHFTTWFTPDSAIGNDALLTLLINGSIEAAAIMKRPVAYGQFGAVKREVFEEIAGYDERLKFGEDSDLSRRIYEAGHMMKILRETVVIYSLRRFRKQGTLKVLQMYSRVAFQFVLTRKTPTDIPSYIMGGHLYTEKQVKASRSLLKQFQRRMKFLTKEIFGP